MKKKKGQKMGVLRHPVSNRNQRRQKTAVGLKSLNNIETMMTLTKEDMETALKSPAIRIHGVLYDVPVFQLQNYLLNNQFVFVKVRLTKAKNQDHSQTKTVNETKTWSVLK